LNSVLPFEKASYIKKEHYSNFCTFEIASLANVPGHYFKEIQYVWKKWQNNLHLLSFSHFICKSEKSLTKYVRKKCIVGNNRTM
jgi:hypothetical protein